MTESLVGFNAFALLFGGWAITAAFFYWLAARSAKARGAANDGCLLGVLNIMLTAIGGLGGFLAVPVYPWSLAASLAGGALLPLLATLYHLRKMR